MSYNDFTDMPIWQEAIEIGEAVFKLTKDLPKSEDYGLTSQLRRASVSISANIAEAFGRTGNKDKAKFYDYARGSAFETNSLLLYGLKVDYFTEEEVYRCIEQNKKIIHGLNKVKMFLLNQKTPQGYLSDIELEYTPISESISKPHPQPESISQPQPQSQSIPQPQSQPQS